MTRKGYTLIAIGGAVGIVVLVVGAYALQWFSAEPRGALDARERTVASGEFRLAAYDHFFGLCSQVQAQEDRAKILEAEKLTATPERATQIDASLSAIRAQRAELIRTYNADATRDYTVGQFRDNDLPYNIDINQESTSCA